MNMDPSKSAQDIIRCDLCEDAIVQMYCDFCQVNLCISCIGKHISDDYDKHKVVPVQQKKSTLIYPTCTTYQMKRCKFHCKECNISVCSLCSIISDTHKGHTVSTLSDVYNAKREVISKDTVEIEDIIYPTYEEIATDLETQISSLDGEYEKLTSAVTEQGEECHRVINAIVHKMKTEIEELKIQHKSFLQKQLDETKELQQQFEETLAKLNIIEESNEVVMTMEYTSQTKEFRKLPSKVLVSLPTFSPKTTDTDQFYSLCGSLTPLSTTTEGNGNTLKKLKTPIKELLEEPELITVINTGYEKLCSVTCFDDEEIWTMAKEASDMKCFNIHDSLLYTIETKSGKSPRDIGVTDDGDLMYSEWKTCSVNIVKNGQTEEVIRLKDWIPSKLCVTSSGDLLVSMYSNDQSQSKVVRYSGSTEKQTIQFDDKGKPLYSGNNNIKYISENKNLDICVADSKGHAVVVVNRSGNLRFRYTGHPHSPYNKPFKPYGITTDSQCHILTADGDNHCIHILDQDGQFLCYIENCDLKDPYGLFVDKRDNLFVAEYHSGYVKKIKYMK